MKEVVEGGVGRGDLGGDSLHNRGRTNPTPLTPESEVFMCVLSFDCCASVCVSTWIRVSLYVQEDEGGAPGVMPLLFCHYSEWKLCLSMEKGAGLQRHGHGVHTWDGRHHSVSGRKKTGGESSVKKVRVQDEGRTAGGCWGAGAATP